MNTNNYTNKQVLCAYYKCDAALTTAILFTVTVEPLEVVQFCSRGCVHLSRHCDYIVAKLV